MCALCVSSTARVRRGTYLVHDAQITREREASLSKYCIVCGCILYPPLKDKP